MVGRKETSVKSVSLYTRHTNWIRDNCINLSRFVQAKIDEEIRKRKEKGDV